MINWFSFSVCSVSLDGGNHTVLDLGEYTDTVIWSIAVLHEECGKTGMIEKRNSVFCMRHFRTVVCIMPHGHAYDSVEFGYANLLRNCSKSV